jgi:hypothetical protein
MQDRGFPGRAALRRLSGLCRGGKTRGEAGCNDKTVNARGWVTGSHGVTFRECKMRNPPIFDGPAWQHAVTNPQPNCMGFAIL